MQVVKYRGKNRLRLLGLGLLVLLLWRADVSKVLAVLRQVAPGLLLLAVLLNLPQIGVKTLRWRYLLQEQGITYPLTPALLSNFGSIFIGLLTPGRLGEFVKAMHVSQDCDIASARAFSTVLADRLFDLYALLLVGGAALLSVTAGNGELLSVVGAVFVLTFPLALFLNDWTFSCFQAVGAQLGRAGRRLFAPEGWLVEMRRGLRQLTWPRLLVSVGLTVLAYVIFFGQCYLLAVALGLSVGLIPVIYAVTLGSLVTLLPVSISGLGTREAVMIAYLGTVGVPAEAAIGFSLLVFVTFYIGGGLIGAAAWWVKPVPLKQMREREAGPCLEASVEQR